MQLAENPSNSIMPQVGEDASQNARGMPPEESIFTGGAPLPAPSMSFAVTAVSSSIRGKTMHFTNE